MDKFCDELRSEREQRQITIETICSVTKVSSRHIIALEAGDYAELPGGVFRKGIVRSYVNALGLDEASWLARFEASLYASGLVEQKTNDDWVEFAENVRRNRGAKQPGTGARWVGVAVMVATLVVLGWGVWKFVLHGRLFS
jgi:cytoskeleton protein RodZ